MFTSRLVTYIQKYLLLGVAMYALLFLFARLLPLPPTVIFSTHELHYSLFDRLFLFSLCWLLGMGSLYVLLSGTRTVDFAQVFLHMGAIAMLGPICEVTINHICRFFFHSPLWTYHVFPIHGGDTSMYSFCVWAMYGCHLYFVDKVLVREHLLYKTLVFSMILSLEVIVLEAALNITSIYFLHTYIFFYLPNDLHHLTTLAVVPFYLCGGALAYETIKRTSNYPIFFGALTFFIGFVFVFLV